MFCSAGVLLLLLVIIPAYFYYLRAKFRRQKEKNKTSNITVGIFHPYCNAGGGGERVLWVALQAMQDKYKNAEFYIYSGDIAATPAEILENVDKCFNIKLDAKIHIVYLHRRKWVEAYKYPYFTLLGQALGSIYLGFEAINQLVPGIWLLIECIYLPISSYCFFLDIFIDTTGFTFSLPVFKYLGQCKTGCYIHYPTITKAMMHRVSARQAIYNNRSIIARSPIFTYAKLVYYRIFAEVCILSFSFCYNKVGNLENIAI